MTARTSTSTGHGTGISDDWVTFPPAPPEAKDRQPDPDTFPRPGDPRHWHLKGRVVEEEPVVLSRSPSPATTSSSARPPASLWPQQALRASAPPYVPSATNSLKGGSSVTSSPVIVAQSSHSQTSHASGEVPYGSLRSPAVQHHLPSTVPSLPNGAPATTRPERALKAFVPPHLRNHYVHTDGSIQRCDSVVNSVEKGDTSSMSPVTESRGTFTNSNNLGTSTNDSATEEDEVVFDARARSQLAAKSKQKKVPELERTPARDTGAQYNTVKELVENFSRRRNSVPDDSVPYDPVLEEEENDFDAFGLSQLAAECEQMKTSALGSTNSRNTEALDHKVEDMGENAPVYRRWLDVKRLRAMEDDLDVAKHITKQGLMLMDEQEFQELHNKVQSAHYLWWTAQHGMS